MKKGGTKWTTFTASFVQFTSVFRVESTPIMQIMSGWIYVCNLTALTLFLVCAFHLPITSYADKLQGLSFEPPFNEIDNSGLRMASRGFRSSGSTTISSNFVRLTPEQQSKKGSLWSREAIELPSFSSILKFRISGRAKDFFGDGIALWFVQQGYWIEGDLHGFQESFIGVGIIFDTFKNTENLAAHRDVTVLGTPTLSILSYHLPFQLILSSWYNTHSTICSLLPSIISQ